MIVPMTKYGIVVYHRDGEAFLEQLQELGLVDVTTAEWEPTAEEQALLTQVEKRRAAIAKLRTIYLKRGTKPFKTADEAWSAYSEAVANIDEIDARIVAARREASELEVWGAFDPDKLRELAVAGVEMRFYSAYTHDFEALNTGEDILVPLHEANGMTYFVALGGAVDARELPTPDATAAQRSGEIKSLEHDREQWEAVVERAAASVDDIEKQTDDMARHLDLSRVKDGADREADSTLLVLEGWATRETAPQVDQFLDKSGTYYIKSHPTPEDEVPVVLKNRRWSSPFEVIGNFYSLPRYGTLDLTAFFGPFYMVFFGFCLGDAGYGLVFMLGALIISRLARKKKSKQLKQVAMLTLLCGGAATVFGFLAGGFFGVSLANVAMFAAMRDTFFTPDMLFVLALGLGLVQIIFALVLRIVNTSSQFGFKYSLGTLGWLMVICALVYFALPSPVVQKFLPALTIKYPVHVSLFYVLAGVGGVLMLFFHNPAKNPLLNLGSGLWNTYNDVTGLLGDLLSYIRLFALCLSGGTLALVFNSLAIGMTSSLPPVASQFVAILILLFGHGLNLFMSALGSFVHPMRLTFVEFYKNAGFEASQREFKPLKKR